MNSTEKFEVHYMRKDLNGINWIHQTKEFYFKDEAIFFKEKIQEKTRQKAYVYKKTTNYKLID